MKGGLYLDEEAPALVQQQFALVRAVGTARTKRKRFPENVVELVDSAEAALARQNPADDVHAAAVMGPSRSSEGYRLYYLVRWLNE